MSFIAHNNNAILPPTYVQPNNIICKGLGPRIFFKWTIGTATSIMASSCHMFSILVNLSWTPWFVNYSRLVLLCTSIVSISSKSKRKYALFAKTWTRWNQTIHWTKILRLYSSNSGRCDCMFAFYIQTEYPIMFEADLRFISMVYYCWWNKFECRNNISDESIQIVFTRDGRWEHPKEDRQHQQAPTPPHHCQLRDRRDAFLTSGLGLIFSLNPR